MVRYAHFLMAPTILLFLATHQLPAAEVDFEVPALGTQYGPGGGHSPGDTVLTQNGISMSVENFTSGVFVGFNGATIKGHPGPPTSEFPVTVNSTQALGTNNINAKFDLTGLAFAVTHATIDYADEGGTENFDLNGLGKQELGDLDQIVQYAGFTINVTKIMGTSAEYGTVEIIAQGANRIETIEIGGQEFAIDNLIAVPEPATLALALLAALAAGITRSRPSG